MLSKFFIIGGILIGEAGRGAWAQEPGRVQVSTLSFGIAP